MQLIDSYEILRACAYAKQIVDPEFDSEATHYLPSLVPTIELWPSDERSIILLRDYM